MDFQDDELVQPRLSCMGGRGREGMRPSSVPAHGFDSYFSSLLQPCVLPRTYVQLSIGKWTGAMACVDLGPRPQITTCLLQYVGNAM